MTSIPHLESTRGSSASYTLGELTPMADERETLARVLLRAFISTSADGNPRRKYLMLEDEGPYRQAFADLLRSNTPLSGDLRSALADLVADDDYSLEREIVF